MEVGSLACASCHDRLMPDGTMIKGAQGNFPFDRALSFIYRSLPPQAVDAVRLGNYRLYATPWLHPDPQARLLKMSADEIASAHEAIPAGVMARLRASPFYPVQVPDLIGVRDRHYLDRTGLQQHRGIVDLMRYAALNQGGDDLASLDGFVPDAIPDFKVLPAPDRPSRSVSARLIISGRASRSRAHGHWSATRWPRVPQGRRIMIAVTDALKDASVGPGLQPKNRIDAGQAAKS